MNSASVRRSSGTKRIEELDFLKVVFILLMISFHLAYFGDGYPYLKKFVYTFHMPGFLIISGYLMNVNKPPRGFGKTILWLAVPYVIMETGYVLMASILPIRDHVDNLSVGVLLQKLFVNPLGPYWYLHTLILSGSLYFAVFRWIKGPELSRFMVLALSYYACSRLGIVSFACAMYFFAGIAVRRSALTFFDIFRKSWLSVAVLAFMFFFPSAFDKASWGGIVIVYSVFSFVLVVYGHVPARPRQVLLFLGRNSLALYIFSPIFTICCKYLIPYLSFDPTRLLFLAISLPVCIGGCLAVCKLSDLLGLSSFIFGRRHIIV